MKKGNPEEFQPHPDSKKNEKIYEWFKAKYYKDFISFLSFHKSDNNVHVILRTKVRRCFNLNFHIDHEEFRKHLTVVIRTAMDYLGMPYLKDNWDVFYSKALLFLKRYDISKLEEGALNPIYVNKSWLAYPIRLLEKIVAKWGNEWLSENEFRPDAKEIKYKLLALIEGTRIQSEIKLAIAKK